MSLKRCGANVQDVKTFDKLILPHTDSQLKTSTCQLRLAHTPSCGWLLSSACSFDDFLICVLELHHYVIRIYQNSRLLSLTPLPCRFGVDVSLGPAVYQAQCACAALASSLHHIFHREAGNGKER
jgi:hypothetical protein